MESSNTNNTIIIMESRKGFDHDGYESEGYKVYSAYKKTCIVTRLLREIWFRIPILPQTVWYDFSILSEQPQYIIVRDPLITREYLLWIMKKFPSAQINFLYQNMIGKARHLYPDKIPKDIRIWTYDGYDSEKYGINLKKISCYFPIYVKEAKEKKYDLLFVGRDKGRGKMLLNLKRYLETNGISTRFLITKDGKFSKKEKYHENNISYNGITELISESRAILNIVMENQHGITIRDLEAIFHKVKLITTNPHIIDADFYNADNVFILNNNNWDELVKFIRKPYVEDSSINLQKYTAKKMFSEITSIK